MQKKNHLQAFIEGLFFKGEKDMGKGKTLPFVSRLLQTASR